jgi:hypothetical protein
MPDMPHAQTNQKLAKYELGMGLSPDELGMSDDDILAADCDPNGKVVIVEVASLVADLPLTDQDINGVLNNNFNLWGLTSGSPPAGFSQAFNTLATPGVIPYDMIILGLSIRVLVEPEAFLIMGNAYTPGGSSTFPGSPDVWSLNDYTNALGLPEGSTPFVPGMLQWGRPTWRAAYWFTKAYELGWTQDHQTYLIREPLTQMARIEMFSAAEAAGIAFASDIDRINYYNAQIAELGSPIVFLPITHKRLGSDTNTGTSANRGIFEPTREDDASSAVFGGVGVPVNMAQKDPYVFSTPVYWPGGIPMGISFQVYDTDSLAEMQRWLSITGGAGGQAGQDQDLPVSAGINGYSPSTTGANIMVEQTLDATPTDITQQVQTNRYLGKGGRIIWEIGLIGRRVGQAYKPAVARAIKRKAISAPMGTGNLPAA